MHRLYIATTNQGKLRDFAGAAGTQIEIAPVPGMKDVPQPIEDGGTFETNARKKAEYYSLLVPGELVVADDSGLEVEALSGAPGVHSARYAAPADRGTSDAHSNSSDTENNARLLRELENVPDEQRTARFVCVLAAARDGKTVLVTRGEVRGMILRHAKGALGFGYDPLFYLSDLGKTTAELTPEEKAKVSHRGQAFRKFVAQYATLQTQINS